MSSDTRNTPDDLLVERQLCFLLHRNTSRFVGRWDRFLRRYNLTYTEYLVLLALWERSPTSDAALGTRLQLDPYTLEDALANLERLRYIVRSPNLGTPMHRVVEATRKCLDLQPEVGAIRQRFSCELGLPKEDADLLVAQLEKLSEALAALDLEDSESTLQPM